MGRMLIPHNYLMASARRDFNNSALRSRTPLAPLVNVVGKADLTSFCDL